MSTPSSPSGATSTGAPLLVGYDGLEGGDAALTEALRLAGELGCDVVLAYAVRVNPMGGEVADYATALEEQARDVLARGMAQAQDSGVAARAEIVRGRVREALPELADAVGARMIVAGATPHRLVQHSRVPVLVVP
jgi:nucleotide-binding universal stress UspA family protein